MGGVDAAYACHPNLVAIPADFDPVSKPLSLALGTKDSLLDVASIGKIQDTLAVKTEIPHEIWVSLPCSVAITKSSTDPLGRSYTTHAPRFEC